MTHDLSVYKKPNVRYGKENKSLIAIIGTGIILFWIEQITFWIKWLPLHQYCLKHNELCFLCLHNEREWDQIWSVQSEYCKSWRVMPLLFFDSWSVTFKVSRYSVWKCNSVNYLSKLLCYLGYLVKIHSSTLNLDQIIYELATQ